MIKHLDLFSQLPNEFKLAFRELKILKHLRSAGIKKNFGYSCASLLQLIFCLIFHNKNWFRLLISKQDQGLPAKDTVYRFLNYPKYAWRQFLLSLSSDTIKKVSNLTSINRVKVLVVDDSAYEKNRSKKVELLSRCFEHNPTKNRFYRGFRMLTLGWSDGFSFMPIDFALMTSKNSIMHGIDDSIDKRTSGYRRRIEALESAPRLVSKMVNRALSSGIEASHVLMDTWFTNEPLIIELLEEGIDVIGMINDKKQRYSYHDKSYTLKQLFSAAVPYQGKKDILSSAQVQTKSGLTVKIVFIKNRNKKSEWLAILSTDLTLSEAEIIRIYGLRWDIEVFFKTIKSFLRLQKEFQGRSYDLLISHTTIVFTRYIVLSWQHRCSNDTRTLGGIFYEMCDEVNQKDWVIALKQLIDLLEALASQTSKKITNVIKNQLQEWMSGLPTYIKVCLSIS